MGASSVSSADGSNSEDTYSGLSISTANSQRPTLQRLDTKCVSQSRYNTSTRAPESDDGQASSVSSFESERSSSTGEYSSDRITWQQFLKQSGRASGSFYTEHGRHSDTVPSPTSSSPHMPATTCTFTSLRSAGESGFAASSSGGWPGALSRSATQPSHSAKRPILLRSLSTLLLGPENASTQLGAKWRGTRAWLEERSRKLMPREVHPEQEESSRMWVGYGDAGTARGGADRQLDLDA